MKQHTASRLATHVSVIACLVISQCEWCAFAQTTAGGVGIPVAENRHEAAGTDAVFPLRMPVSSVLFATSTPRVTVRTEAALWAGSPLPNTDRGTLGAAVAAAVADARARPASAVANARAASAQGGSKNRALMWILIAAGAGGAVAAVALLKDSDPPPEPTVTVGTLTVGP